MFFKMESLVGYLNSKSINKYIIIVMDILLTYFFYIMICSIVTRNPAKIIRYIINDYIIHYCQCRLVFPLSS